jgi:hypothetical protein
MQNFDRFYNQKKRLAHKISTYSVLVKNAWNLNKNFSVQSLYSYIFHLLLIPISSIPFCSACYIDFR